MFEDDVTYYRRRAEAELEKAQQDGRPEVVRVHYLLAEAYLERVATAEPVRQVEHA